jgi:nucleolar GTP-binding protein
MPAPDVGWIRWDDLPPILNSTAILDKAFKRAAKAHGRGRTRAERAKSESVARVHSLGDTISSTIAGYVKAFPSIGRLPPFYRDLMHILVDVEKVRHDLGTIDWCRKKVQEFSKAYSREIGRSSDAGLVEVRRKEAYGRISSLVHQVAESLECLEAARRRLSSVPMIDLEAPTVVVAGTANVGKSQFVAAVSTAKPKVAQYPFTTKEISLGHTERGHLRIQVLDTPGLLDRPAGKRNPIEQQAASALKNLAKLVIFLYDPTETCGFTMQEQIHLFERLREEFPDVRFVEVENKVDLKNSGSGRMKVSALTGRGVDKVLDHMAAMLTNRAPGASPPRRAD